MKEGVMKVVFLLAACMSILAVALICIFLFANGVPAIHTEAELEKDPSVSVSCDAYHCQIDYCDNDILSLTATPLTHNDCSNISLYVTQYF